MIPEIDIWRTARAMVKRHGEDAAIEAVIRVDEFLDAGDVEGCAKF